MADVACPTGYTQITEDVVYTSSGNSCPNGDTKLAGEYGEDSILNCIGAQSNTISICTYFVEQCQIGMSFDGASHQPCPDGAYYCDGSGTATPGVAGCSSVCPTPRNTVGAPVISSGARQDLNGNNLYDSINECGVLYMFVESWMLPLVGVEATDTYKPDSDANVRGNAYVYCAYNNETDEYDINCVGYPVFCAGGYYSSGWGAGTHKDKFEDGIPIYGMKESGGLDNDKLSGTLSLDELIQVYCEPVGENYWSESGKELFDAGIEGEELHQRTLGRTPCPANSSTKGATTATYCTCNDGYTLTGTIGGNIQTTTDACRPIPEFSIITTFMDAGTEFSFKISAAGEYTIDWGDGNVESIVKTDTENMTFSHTYTSGGVHTIGIGGDATEYYTSPNGNSYQPAISFANNTNVAKLVGSLGAIFGGSAEWMFSNTFSNCTSLTEIPENLFSGQRSGADRMFYGTFRGCTSLTEVPANLFSGITDSAEYMFYHTFDGCTSLTSITGSPFPNLTGSAPSMFSNTFANCTSLTNIPRDLFAGVSGSATDMFSNTFANCTSLTNIPKELFSGISGGAEGMFDHTFHNCTSLVDIPATLFSGINTSAYQMFNQTFRNCSSLTEIPGTLFQNIKGESAQEVFSGTFANCTSLTSVPNGLFKNITGKPAEYAFYGVFYECTNLTGTVPVDLFENLDSADYVSGPMEFIFNGTNLDTQCPSGTYQYITGFESDWDGHVACTPCPTAHPNSAAGSTSETQCYTTCTKQCIPQTCPDNSINCVHGNDVTTGIQYVGGVCDAKESACNISFDCSTGYTKSGLAQWAINNIDLLIENETDLPMCGLDGFGSCDELKPGEWASYYTDGLPIKNATGVAVCNSVPGDDSSFDARINKDADFDLNTTGNYCWMKVQTVNDSFLPASWVYGWQYDSPEQCADDCGWSLNPDFQTVELAIIWGAQYDVCVANEYTVTYDCNGGAGNTTETVTYNSVFTPRTDVCEYDGYQFTGWTLNSATVSDSFTWNYTDNQTLVATWTQCAPGSYCTGDGTSNTCPTDNSGRVVTSTTGAVTNTDCYVTCPETISVENAKSVIVTDKTPNYNGTIYPECTYTATCNDGYSVQNNGTANPICTPNTYTVTYIAGRVNPTVDVVYNTAFTFSQPIPDKTGYTGTGWLGQNNQLYTLNQTIIYDMAYNLAVAPQYVANEYTVTYDCNGGAGNTTETVTYNSVFDLRTDVCEYDGYLFAGWTLNGTTVSDSFTWNYTDNQTLVATWTRLSLDCPYNEELVNGKCTPCNRDNALSYSPTGNCMVTECTDGFYPYMQECVPENIICDAPNADMAYKHWNVENRAYGPCIISECTTGFHVSANTCVPNTQSCVLEHGIGEQTWDLIQEQWGKCIATECMPGYTTDSRLTNDMLDGQCGRCSNMFVDNDLAVSSYISECEIASCMYQGEKYTLENNECILICDEYSDETGSRYWDGKKCFHDCADGYTIWE